MVVVSVVVIVVVLTAVAIVADLIKVVSTAVEVLALVETEENTSIFPVINFAISVRLSPY